MPGTWKEVVAAAETESNRWRKLYSPQYKLANSFWLSDSCVDPDHLDAGDLVADVSLLKSSF